MLRHRLSAIALAAGALLVLAGCGSQPAAAPSNEPPSDAPAGDVQPLEATWLDDGRWLGVVTWGSSGCAIVVDEVTADGQDITVTSLESDTNAACTADHVPRPTVFGVPEGVDPTQDATVSMLADGVTYTTPLAGDSALTGVPGQPGGFTASAGWVDSGIILLTWGSSTCTPQVSELSVTDGGATVVFDANDRMCTMDMAPRATYLESSELVKQPGFVLTLEGDNLDGTVSVIGG